MRVINRLLRLRLPGRIGGRVIRVDANDVEFVEVLEFVAVEIFQLAAEYQMEQLWRGLIGHIAISWESVSGERSYREILRSCTSAVSAAWRCGPAATSGG